MDSYMKENFSPPILSRKWIAIKFRPNMLIYNRKHIISILESGLLFREDSVTVEQETPASEEVWTYAGGMRGGWLTTGEGVVSVATLAACIALFPVRSLTRSSLLNMLAYTSIPVAVRMTHRARCSGALPSLLGNLRDYITLARRATICLKEYSALYTQLASVMSIVESLHVLLCRQQSYLTARMAHAINALHAAAPWLESRASGLVATLPDNLTQIHHAFLVIQSTLLKNIALAHCNPPPHVKKLYKNHNERIYWLHNVLIHEINEELQENLQALQRMYRLIKNSTTKDNESKKLGVAISKNWLYSDVHNGVARVCLELKVALDKSNTLDVFLDSCAVNNEEFDPNLLNKDIDVLIDNITKCLATLQNSQIMLKRLKGKVDVQPPMSEENDLVETAAILKIADKEPETRDEVFYFMKTDEDDLHIEPAGDLTTAPGKREKETTKIVLTELKRKLGKREDLMRERERQALVKTMPDLKNVPEFPRQINYDEYLERKGFIVKIKRNLKKGRLFRNYKIENKPISKYKKYKSKVNKYEKVSDIKCECLEANSLLNVKSRLITLSSKNKSYYVIRWFKSQSSKDLGSFGMSDGLSDVEVATVNRAVNSNDFKAKFSKKDLELSASSSASDTEYYQEQRQLLKDVRRHRVARRKNHPSKAKAGIDKQISIDDVDESLKPIEYSLGTGLAMASVLQVNDPRFLNMAQEEVFVGDGEVSNDSGNDEDA